MGSGSHLMILNFAKRTHPGTEQRNAGPPIHCALERFQPIDLPFSLTITRLRSTYMYIYIYTSRFVARPLRPSQSPYDVIAEDPHRADKHASPSRFTTRVLFEHNKNNFLTSMENCVIIAMLSVNPSSRWRACATRR